jgi:hypothetical protein
VRAEPRAPGTPHPGCKELFPVHCCPATVTMLQMPVGFRLSGDVETVEDIVLDKILVVSEMALSVSHCHVFIV